MSLFDQLAGLAGPAVPTCSRKGCRAPADWQLLWNNPRLHTPERRKAWLACTAHRDWLQDYLVQRGLWKETLPLEPPPGTAALPRPNPDPNPRLNPQPNSKET